MLQRNTIALALLVGLLAIAAAYYWRPPDCVMAAERVAAAECEDGAQRFETFDVAACEFNVFEDQVRNCVSP